MLLVSSSSSVRRLVLALARKPVMPPKRSNISKSVANARTAFARGTGGNGQVLGDHANENISNPHASCSSLPELSMPPNSTRL